MASVGAKGARQTLIAIPNLSRSHWDLILSTVPKMRLLSMLVAAAQSGTQNSASETHFRVRRPRPVVPAEQPLQTISLRANALNSRGIVGSGNPGWFAPTSWWWTQSDETGLPWAIPCPQGRNREIS